MSVGQWPPTTPPRSDLTGICLLWEIKRELSKSFGGIVQASKMDSHHFPEGLLSGPLPTLVYSPHCYFGNMPEKQRLSSQHILPSPSTNPVAEPTGWNWNLKHTCPALSPSLLYKTPPCAPSQDFTMIVILHHLFPLPAISFAYHISPGIRNRAWSCGAIPTTLEELNSIFVGQIYCGQKVNLLALCKYCRFFNVSGLTIPILLYPIWRAALLLWAELIPSQTPMLKSNP